MDEGHDDSHKIKAGFDCEATNEFVFRIEACMPCFVGYLAIDLATTTSLQRMTWTDLQGILLAGILARRS